MENEKAIMFSSFTEEPVRCSRTQTGAVLKPAYNCARSVVPVANHRPFSAWALFVFYS